MAINLKMLYPRQEPLPLADKERTYIFMTDAKKLKITLTKAWRERDAWKNKYQVINNEDEEVQRKLKMKNEEEIFNKKRKVQDDLFSSSVQSDTPWKLIVDKLVLEKAEMEEQIKTLNLRLLGESP